MAEQSHRGRRHAADTGESDGSPRPTHPWPQSIALLTGVMVLLILLSLMSTFR